MGLSAKESNYAAAAGACFMVIFVSFIKPKLIVTEFFNRRMASNRGQGGIQQLLAAEQEAQRIVNASRSGIFALSLSITLFFDISLILVISISLDPCIIYAYLSNFICPTM